MNTRNPKRVLFANPWWHQDIINGTVHHCAERGWHLDLQVCRSGKLPQKWNGDGIITMLGGDIEEIQSLLKDSGCPAVSLNSSHPEMNIPVVTQDSASMGALAAEHFLERGFTNFAYYSHGQSILQAQARCETFEQKQSGSGNKTFRLLWEADRDGNEDSWLNRLEWLRRKLNSLPKPIAIFATNDEAASEVIEACLTENISVPDDIAILGALDIPVYRRSTTISLSSIMVDFDTITGTACDLLSRMMAGEPPPTEPILFPPTGIATRQSTDTFAAGKPEVTKAIRFMFDHFPEAISISDITRASGTCKSLLYDAFRSDIDQTPGAMLTRIRVDQAKRMLIETDEKVNTIAESCGFVDRINLHRHFKRRFGTSPAAYRKQAELS